MKNSAFLFAGVILTVVQSNLFRPLGALLHFIGWIAHTKQDLVVPGLVPSLVLPLIFFMGVHEYSLVRGAAVAFALGYLSDLIGIAPIGLHTSTYVATFILARAAGLRLAAQTMLMQVGLALAFTLIHSLMLLMLVAIFGRDPYVPRALYPMTLPHVLATGLVAPLIFRLAARIHGTTMAGTTVTTRRGESRAVKEAL